MAQVNERLKAGDGAGLARLTQRISMSLLANSYRDDPEAWKSDDEEGDPHMPKMLPPSIGRGQARKPYCEVLIVSPGERSTWEPVREGMRKLRRDADQFVYRAGGGRQLRGRGARGARQLQHPGGGDVRRLRLRVADPASRPARAARGAPAAGRRGARRRSRHAARARGARDPARARRLPRHRPRRRQARRRRRGGGDPARVLRAGGDARAAPRDPRRPVGPLRARRTSTT